MRKTTIYIIFTDTGTNLSRIINFFTRQTLNHVSIGFDKALTEVYSFGRKRPKNPFSGGFVREDIRGEFLKHADAAVYALSITEDERDSILSNIKQIESNQNSYKYNFIGLIGVLLKIEIKRKYAFFCSEFVADVMRDAESINLSKPTYFTTPSDIKNIIGMQLIYTGKLGQYQYPSEATEKDKECAEANVSKPSLLFSIRRMLKHIVIR